MKHYYCESCGGLDTSPHECRTEGCPKKGQPLTEHDADDLEAHKQANQIWKQQHQNSADPENPI